jgi:hypothetical protein
MSIEDSARFTAPFEYIKSHVHPMRSENRREARAKRWWIHGDPQKAMRLALQPLHRYVCTPRVSKHRIFVWLAQVTLLREKIQGFRRVR